MKFKFIKYLILATTLSLLTISDTYSENAGGATALDQISNYKPDYIPNWVEAGKPLVFHIGIYNNSGLPILNVRGFFEIYSTDGAVWQPIDASWVSSVNWSTMFDGGVMALKYSADGAGADTAHFNSFNLLAPGFPNLSVSPAWIISTQIDQSQVGKHICLDSVKNSHGTAWLWTSLAGNFAPTWPGTYCFTIEADCCQNIRGDVNGDGFDSNTLDLSFLVERVFRGGPPPPCAMEADLNGDGASANVTDLTYLIDFIFRGGPAGVSCP